MSNSILIERQATVNRPPSSRYRLRAEEAGSTLQALRAGQESLFK